MLGQGQGLLGRFAEQQVALADALRQCPAAQAELQLRNLPGIGHLQLQRMAERAQQLAAAQRMTQVVLVVALMEQHQAAAVAQDVQFALVEAAGLFQAVPVAVQQIDQALAGQAAQLILLAELHGQHGAGAGARLGSGEGGGHGRGGCRVEAHLVQIDERIVLVQAVGHGAARWCAAGFGLPGRFEFRLVIQDQLRVRFRGQVLFGLGERGQAYLQRTRQLADLVLAPRAGRQALRIVHPVAERGQRAGQVAPHQQRQPERGGEQDQAEQRHALQADAQRLAEILHVQADAQLTGEHFLEGDRRGEQAVFGIGRAAAGLGEDAVVRAVHGGVGHQRVLHQIAQQHVEAEDVVGHQQAGGRGGGLGAQGLADHAGLLLGGLAQLVADHPGVQQQHQGHHAQAQAGDAQGDGQGTAAQGVEQSQEQVVGSHGPRVSAMKVAGVYGMPGGSQSIPA